MTDRSAVRLYRRMSRGRITWRTYFDLLWRTGAMYDRRQYERIRVREQRRSYLFMMAMVGWYFAVLVAWLLGYLPLWVYAGVAIASVVVFGSLTVQAHLRICHFDRED